MKKWISRATLALSMCGASACLAVDEAKPELAFKMQEIDTSLTVGYAVRVADINADGKPDILVCDSARVIWFSNPDWKLHVVIDNKTAGVKADNVCIDTYDIDGDGKLDIALGADWLPNNTTGGGSLQWLKQPADLSQPWTMHKIADSIPTLHRIHFGDLDGDGRKELLVGPLKGVGSTAKAAWGRHGVGVDVLCDSSRSNQRALDGAHRHRPVARDAQFFARPMGPEQGRSNFDRQL